MYIDIYDITFKKRIAQLSAGELQKEKGKKSTNYNDLINFGVGGDHIKHKASLPLY